MILTVTLNPCIDRTLNVSDFRVGGTTAVSGSRAEIGGKGLNVSRVLKNLGADTLCLGFSHEKGGSDLKAALDAVSIPCDLEEIPGELRVNIKIFDESSRTMSELNDKFLILERQNFSFWQEVCRREFQQIFIKFFWKKPDLLLFPSFWMLPARFFLKGLRADPGSSSRTLTNFP